MSLKQTEPSFDEEKLGVHINKVVVIKCLMCTKTLAGFFSCK